MERREAQESVAAIAGNNPSNAVNLDLMVDYVRQTEPNLSPKRTYARAVEFCLAGLGRSVKAAAIQGGA